MEKPKLIIVEGCPAVGKSSVTNLLREKLVNTTLFRLSSIKHDRNCAVYSYHSSLLLYLFDMRFYGMNCVMDRSFLSQYVYARLGYKDHTFERETDMLLKRLNILAQSYDIHFVLLVANKSDFEQRLMRDKAQYVEHSVENSMKQQNEYLKVFDEIETNFEKHIINNSGLTADQTADLILSYL